MVKKMETQKSLPTPPGVCGKQTEVYSRIVGYFRPVKNWNVGKKEEFKDRNEFSEEKSMKSEFKPKQ